MKMDTHAQNSFYDTKRNENETKQTQNLMDKM